MGGGVMPRFLLEIDVGEHLAVLVAHDKAGVVHLVERQRRREAARRWHGATIAR
jgi:hypothetical protein